MSKVVSESGETTGLLVADVLPETLVSAKLSYSAFDMAGESFIVKDGKTLSVQSETLNMSKKGRMTILQIGRAHV